MANKFLPQLRAAIIPPSAALELKSSLNDPQIEDFSYFQRVFVPRAQSLPRWEFIRTLPVLQVLCE